MAGANREWLVEQFIEFTSLDSESFHEKAVAAKLKPMLEALGFDVIEDNAAERCGSECGNIYGFLKGNADKKPVLLSAHMDTVKPGLGKKPHIITDEEGRERIVSDGTTVLGGDDVCGIVEILDAVRMAKEDPEGHGDIEVLFTVAEETNGDGARSFDYSRIKSHDAYVIDLTGSPGHAANAAPSIISFTIKITGKAAHAGFEPENGINALQAAASAISKIQQGRLSPEMTLNIGTISAGIQTNIVPGECVCKGEVRGLDHEATLSAAKKVGETFRAEAEKIGASCDFDYTVHIRAYRTSEDAEVSKCFRRACKTMGLPGNLVPTHGGSDNNMFAEKGIDGLVVSCGMQNVHATDEFALVEDLVTGAELIAAIIRERKPL
ncbi:MAG: M20/M25/M40 family metallo-hydrolase [Mogibacterium sp.]|nr:M20/M25/M40 family metallo-hydrolase [Mogibacterium sp.]